MYKISMDNTENQAADNILEIEGLDKAFRQGVETVRVLNGLSFTLKAGEMVALVGPSGAGKSTFLQICGLLDNLSCGRIIFDGEDVSTLSDRKRTLLRRHHIGFVYQFHYLLPEFTARENLMIPRIIAGISKKEARAQADAMLTDLGLEHRLTHRPPQLSGGEQQRVAVGRALINAPKLLLADEPTGNLDPDNGQRVLDILLEKVRSLGTSVVMATHNHALAARMDRIVTLKNGALEQL